MPLTSDDLNAVRAQWEEWTAGWGFELSMEVKEDRARLKSLALAQSVGVRLRSSIYIHVEIRKHKNDSDARTHAAYRHTPHPCPTGPGAVVFSERVPYDAQALRASVAVLSRAIAGHMEGGDGDEAS